MSREDNKINFFNSLDLDVNSKEFFDAYTDAFLGFVAAGHSVEEAKELAYEQVKEALSLYKEAVAKIYTKEATGAAQENN